MRSALILPLVCAAAFAQAPRYDAPGGGAIRLDTSSPDRVKVASDYWRLEFDLRSGGMLDTVVFPEGSGGNLLLAPASLYVDHFTAANAPGTAVRTSQDGNIARLEFSGRLASSGRTPAPVEFRASWTLSPFVARVDYTLRFLEDAAAARAGVGSMTLRPDLDEWGLRAGFPDDPNPRKMSSAGFGKVRRAGEILISEHHAPVYLLFFQRLTEGLDITMASDLAAWESGLARRGGVGRYEARVADDGASIGVTMEPLSLPRPVRIAKGEYTFSYYLGLPRITARADRRWMHLSFGNHPWPSDEDVARWADAGVNIVRLHNDYAADGNFWHDGAWPPYDERGMAEMRRVVAACKRHRIKVVPYFSIHEFHPEAQGYRENEQAWKRSTDQAGTVLHNRTGSGEFGAQMCPRSGWLERRKQDIEKAFRELGFDGIYYDWVMSLACNNPHHDPKLHLGTDAVIDLLAWTRRLVGPGGPLILHLYGTVPSIAFENFADLVVNMEEISSVERLIRMDEVPIVTVLAESIPRSPCPSYRRDNALERNRRNIAHLAVLGMFPWSGAARGEVYEETLKLFRAFKPYDLENYRFRGALSGAVKTSWEDVHGAIYSSPDNALAVLSNTSPEGRKNVVWRLDPADTGLGQAARLLLRDVKTGRTAEIAAAALTDGSLLTDLEGYEYRLFEIRPLR